MKKEKNKILILIILTLIMACICVLNFAKTENRTTNVQPLLYNTDFQKDELLQIENIVKRILLLDVNKLNESLSDSNSLSYSSIGKLRDPFTLVAPKKTPALMKKARKVVKKPYTKSVKKTQPKKSQPKLVLSGIIFDRQVPIAIINGKVCKEGDTISNFRIVGITRNGVKLVSRKDQLFLKAPEFD